MENYIAKVWSVIVFAYFCTPKIKRVDLVAQLVEHNTFNVGALGSSPSGITEEVVIPLFL